VAPPAQQDSESRRGRGLARTALRGTAWVGASRLSGKILFFLSTVLLARMLDQEDFGVAAYAITVIALFSAIPGLGLGPALIYYRDDQRVLSTGFWLGLMAGGLGFALMWTLAPLTEHLFGDQRAVDVTRALGLVFPFEAMRNVHATILSKRLDFKRRFVPELVQATTKGGLAIALAMLGFGYWSLIWGAVAAAVVGVPAWFRAARWRPDLHFDTGEARRLMAFGGHVVAVNLMGALIRNLDYLLVGRLLGAAVLGVYVLAFRIPDLLIRNLCVLLGQVLLPLYARVKEDSEAVRETFVATTSYVFALTAPMAIGMILVAEPLVLSIFSEKWIDVVPVIVPICLYALFVSLEYNIGDLYKALGRPEVLSRLALVRAALVVPALWYGAGVVGTAAAVGWAQAAVAFVAMVINVSVARRLFDLPVGAAASRLLPIVGATAVMAVAVQAVDSLLSGQWPVVRLVLCALVGAGIYVVALRLFARRFVDLGLSTLRDALSGRGATLEATS
jgi:O-antigen/teichoic acid export membrane protein